MTFIRDDCIAQYLCVKMTTTILDGNYTHIHIMNQAVMTNIPSSGETGIFMTSVAEETGSN